MENKEICHCEEGDITFDHNGKMICTICTKEIAPAPPVIEPPQKQEKSDILTLIRKGVSDVLYSLYSFEVKPEDIKIESTNKDFEGDYTLVVFPYLKVARKNPMNTADEIGKTLQQNVDCVSSYNVVKGFLNLVISDSYPKPNDQKQQERKTAEEILQEYQGRMTPGGYYFEKQQVLQMIRTALSTLTEKP